MILKKKGSHLFRYGGEKFVVLLPGASKKRGVEKAEEIRKTVERLETNYNGTLIKCTLSLGVCCVKGGDDISWGDLLSSTQKAEKNKEQGRNVVVHT
ncbi:GGDEF domain-containing protein [Thermodesulfobacteriota bacterium]